MVDITVIIKGVNDGHLVKDGLHVPNVDGRALLEGGTEFLLVHAHGGLEGLAGLCSHHALPRGADGRHRARVDGFGVALGELDLCVFTLCVCLCAYVCVSMCTPARPR